MKILASSELNIASEILKNGGLIAFPTETVFGFGVIYDNAEAYKRLIEVKRRPPEKPFTLMCANIDDVFKYAEVSSTAEKLIKAYMPGQFTIILKAKNNLPDYVVSKEGNVGIRISSDKNVRSLIRMVGKPLLVPSANKSGEPPLTKSGEVQKQFENEIDALIEGESYSKLPSTIVLIDNDVHVLREGIIKKEQIFALLGGK